MRNRLPEPPPVSVWKMLFTQVTDFMVLTLLVVALISLGLQDWIEAVVLLLVVVTNVTIGFIQELKAEKALQVYPLLFNSSNKKNKNNNNTITEADNFCEDISQPTEFLLFFIRL